MEPRRTIGAFGASKGLTTASLLLGDESRTQWIPFDIPTHPQEVVIVANRDRLEPPLVNCSLSLEPTMYLPSSGVGGREPVHEA